MRGDHCEASGHVRLPAVGGDSGLQGFMTEFRIGNGTSPKNMKLNMKNNGDDVVWVL